jgi:hypothetical protein
MATAWDPGTNESIFTRRRLRQRRSAVTFAYDVGVNVAANTVTLAGGILVAQATGLTKSNPALTRLAVGILLYTASLLFSSITRRILRILFERSGGEPPRAFWALTTSSILIRITLLLLIVRWATPWNLWYVFVPIYIAYLFVVLPPIRRWNRKRHGLDPRGTLAKVWEILDKVLTAVAEQESQPTSGQRGSGDGAPDNLDPGGGRTATQ